jgi:hypothetical protein
MALDVVTLVQELAADDDGGEVEGMLVVGLDAEGRICGVAINSRHRALSFVKVWELSALADELDAASLVVALFPHGGTEVPTDHEVSTFRDLCARAHRARVVLADCLVVRGGRTWSLRDLSEVHLHG